MTKKLIKYFRKYIIMFFTMQNSVIIILIFIGTLTIIGSSVTITLAESTNATQNNCPHGSYKGLVCAPVNPTFHLPTASWKANIGGVDAILTTSLDNASNVQGIVIGGRMLCLPDSPCKINGTFDQRSGKISFVLRPTVPTFLAVSENYTGFISEKVILDVVEFTLAGTGKIIKPVEGQEFPWYATHSCIISGVVGCWR
jgi:hypothetical protein